MGTTVSSRLAESQRAQGGRGNFGETRWSVVLAAGDCRKSDGARRAMGELARIYWFALYAFARRTGAQATRAEDLVQGFWVHLMEKDALAGVAPGKGKFRSFLMVAMKNHMANERDKERAVKRGGGVKTVSIDAMDAEQRYAMEPVEGVTAERLFERRWALAVLEEVLRRLRGEYQERGQSATFEALEGVLIKGEKAGYGSLGARLGMSEGAVKVAAHRLRKRYRELLREEIAQTVSEEWMVEEEMRDLMERL
jgi:RNA polymerase sigma factor (sigma-70 family)